MEHTKNIPSAPIAPDNAILPTTLRRAEASDPPSRTPRFDGWTPDRIHIFLHTLAQTGVVADAARAAGMSVQGAYAFRNSARGRAFDVAWRAAMLLARRRIADEVVSRAINGVVDVIIRDGEVWGERHHYDNRLTMAVLTRLDGLALSNRQQDDVPRRVAEEYDALVDSVCAGPEAATDFIESRMKLHYRDFEEVAIIDRNLENSQASRKPAMRQQRPKKPSPRALREKVDPGFSHQKCDREASPWQPSISSTSPPERSSPEQGNGQVRIAPGNSQPSGETAACP